MSRESRLQGDDEASAARSALRSAKRVVIKAGTRVLTAENGRPDDAKLRALVGQIAALRKDGREVIFVTSGAIGSGMEALGLKRRPKGLPQLQAAAAIGQGRLMSRYSELFEKHGVVVGQLLLTYDDLRNRARHLNVRNTLFTLLRENAVPIINENDVVAVDEIKLGDNDTLASLVALLSGADTLVLLTTTNGLMRDSAGGRARIGYLSAVSDDILALAAGKGSELSVGGMTTKLHAARSLLSAGSRVAIADGGTPQILRAVFDGEDVGTLIAEPEDRRRTRLTGKKKWLAYFQRPQGEIIVDEGAAQALASKGRSLLPIGVREVHGRFESGSLVNVKTTAGLLVARGLACHSSDEIASIRGKRSAEVTALLGPHAYLEVIHRDNLVLMS